MTVREDCQESVRRSLSLREGRSLTRQTPTVSRRRSFVGTRKTPLRAMPNAVVESSSLSTPTTLSPLINHPNSRVLLPLRASIRGQTHRPDGSEGIPLGPRGAPDGSECNLRDEENTENPVDVLEKHYEDVKAVVQDMEEKIDRENISEMKIDPDLSCSQAIHDAYERMKIETKDLDDISPAEKLTRRLDRELKIRSRRSGEPRVMRSPSERRIGSIRRRSKEMEQQQQLMKTEEKPSTPRFKGNLMMQSPQTALRRGRPNS